MVDLKEKAISLLSTTVVSFGADGQTTLYTVPSGVRCVLHSAVIVAAADAGATVASIGQLGALTDFVPANTLSNLDTQYDSVILCPVPATTPLKNKSYPAGAVIQIDISSFAGSPGNTVMLFGTLY